MSLLLDALKKSGDASRQDGGAIPELELEAPPAPKVSPAFESPATSKPSVSASRAAGEKMFNAKKTPPRKRWKLGLVPTTLLICSTLGAGYGYYVWLQIQPPKQQVAQRVAPPPAPPVAAAPVALPPLVPLTPEPAPAVAEAAAQKEEAQTSALPAAVLAEVPAAHKAAARPKSSAPLQIQHKPQLNSIDQMLSDAYQSYQSGDSAKAWQLYREVLNKDANNRDALLGLAVIAQQQGQDEASQHYYRQVLKLDPRDPVANAGLSMFSTGSVADTESQLKKLIAEQPNSAALYFALGNHYAGQSRWGDAQQAYFSAYTAEPRNAQFAFNLAISLDHLGQSKSAIRYYQMALQLDTSGNSGFDRAQTQQRLNALSNSGH